MAIKTILVVGAELSIRKEGIAGAAVTPGHLVQGPASAIIVHAGAGLSAQKSFAVENEVVGNPISEDYAANDTLLYAVCPPGSIVYAIAAAAGVTAEDFVESTGDGTLRTVATSAATADTARNSVIGKALDTAGAGVRFRCEIY
ncbi:hypothetical protein LCGC14_2850570 [marine sediment metagenome]|uniref:Uncharacterized protein n=1 Tax=marine sediment metagenome TaxID=412755 RepID=A0A0F8Y8N8_9ZZZZ